MSIDENCLMTEKDHALLATLKEQCPEEGDHPLRSLIERKLAAATVVRARDLPPGVVTLDSRVTYRVDDGPAEKCILAAGDGASAALPPLSLRAVALLGLAEGRSIALPLAAGKGETLTVVRVVRQPAKRPIPSFLRVVHSADEPPQPPAPPQRPMLPRGGGDFDDPGPSAA